MDDAQQEALASLTQQMFAESIATGEVVVEDPEPQPPPVQAPQPAVPAVQERPTGTFDSSGDQVLINGEPAVVALAPPEPVAAPEAVPTFKTNFDDDQRALLDEPDFEDEARAEVAAEVEEGEYEYTDPETTAKVRALEKRNQFLEDRNVAISKKNWVEEAKRVFPDLARLLPGEIEGIAATSRRGFLREADKINTRYATVLAPTLARLEAERAAIATGAVAVAREEVAAAWGRPAADTLPSDAAATAEALAKARATGNLEESIKVLMKDNPVL